MFYAKATIILGAIAMTALFAAAAFDTAMAIMYHI